jgi:hypothetical protein
LRGAGAGDWGGGPTARRPTHPQVLATLREAAGPRRDLRILLLTAPPGAIEIASVQPGVRDSRAWYLATDPDPDARDAVESSHALCPRLRQHNFCCDPNHVRVEPKGHNKQRSTRCEKEGACCSHSVTWREVEGGAGGTVALEDCAEKPCWEAIRDAPVLAAVKRRLEEMRAVKAEVLKLWDDEDTDGQSNSV